MLLCVAFVRAHLLRYEWGMPASTGATVANALPLVLALKMGVLNAYGIYREQWRYADFLDLIRLGQAASAASLVAVAGLFLLTRLQGISRTALILDWMLREVVVVPADLDGCDERVREMFREAGVQVRSMGRLIE